MTTMPSRRRRRAASLAAMTLIAALGTSCAGPDLAQRQVVAVANNVSGTVSLLDASTYRTLGSINVVPDLQERLAEIDAEPNRATLYRIQKQLQALKVREPGQGDAAGDRFADDIMFSPDGRTMYVSRSNLGDVVAMDLTKRGYPFRWRFRVDGLRADHAQLSPDGAKLVVSSSTGNVAQVLSTADGTLLGKFPTGAFPHQNDFSHDGTKIYNASIGNVVTVPYADNAKKGPKLLTVADATTYQVIRTYEFEFGIRPAVFADQDRTMFVQLSYQNGVSRFDMETGQIVQQVTIPFSPVKEQYYPNEDAYPHDSAFHGLAMSGDRLCAAGTINDYVVFLRTSDLSTITVTSAPGAALPYWAVNSRDGTKCIVSNAGSGDVSVYDYATGRELTRSKVGLYPGRSRVTSVVNEAVKNLAPSPG